MILDLGLPDLDGVAVVEGLRGWSTAPIIVLSARHEEQAKVRALDAGADDYVTKPFGMDELLARMRAATRRGPPPTASAVVTTTAFTIDLSARRVTAQGEDIRLTPTEWHLLEILVRGADRLITQQQLLQQVWGPGYQTETKLPTGAPGQSAPETRARPRPPALPDHRTWHRIPVSTRRQHLSQ